MPQLFLSYARANAEQAERLYKDLRRSTGHEIWFDRKSLVPGVRREPAIRKAIRESRYFVALLSKSSVSERGFRHSELRQALEVLAEYPSDQIYLIPVRLDECAMPDSALNGLNRADLFPTWAKGVESIVEAIGGKKAPTPRRPPTAQPATQFRVALLGLGVATPMLRRVADGLNGVQDFFIFSVPDPHAYRKAAADAIETINEGTQFVVDRVAPTFFEQSRFLAVDLIAWFSDRPLAFTKENQFYSNYFSFATGPQGRFLFLSSDLLKDMTAMVGQKLEDGLAYLLIGILIEFFTDTGYHKETRDCPLDHCANRTHVVYGLNARRLCGQCSRALKTPGLRSAVSAMLRWRAD